MTETSQDEVFERMARSWKSEIVSRTAIGEFSGGLLTTGYMQNLDSDNQGPAKIRFGRKIAYPKVELIQWLKGRVA